MSESEKLAEVFAALYRDCLKAGLVTPEELAAFPRRLAAAKSAEERRSITQRWFHVLGDRLRMHNRGQLN